MDQATLFRLTYASRSMLSGEPHQVEREVGRILDASRRNNARLSITGALLFSGDCFAQSLEGRFDAVQSVFERIQLDSRHTDTVVLEAGGIDQRGFGDWSMAYTGRIDDDRVRFNALTRGSDAIGGAGAERVLDLLRAVVHRAAPALV